MSELKPCPFHGNLDCPCYADADMDMEEWNTRPTEDELKAKLEAVREAHTEWTTTRSTDPPLVAIQRYMAKIERAINEGSGDADKTEEL